MLRIGINGFGRIGRMIVRAFFANREKFKNIQIVCINDISPKDMNIHLLKYDSVHGIIDVFSTDNGLNVNDTEISMISEADPEKIKWSNYNVDIVLECSGRFTKRADAAKHLCGGAKRVIVSAPSDGADLTVVYGINHTEINDSHIVISNGSCTTNCILPIVYILDKKFGIQSGYMTTVHSYTGDQRLLDTCHKDPRRARSAAMSIIPTSTGAARSVGLILKHLNGKLDGCSIRVPTPNVSLVDFSCILNKSVDENSVNDVMKNAANTEFSDILGYSSEPLVSVDFNGRKESSIFDETGTKVLDGTFCRIMSWYDNEYGFSNRMLDVCEYLAS